MNERREDIGQFFWDIIYTQQKTFCIYVEIGSSKFLLKFSVGFLTYPSVNLTQYYYIILIFYIKFIFNISLVSKWHNLWVSEKIR